jgi:hypothetical protein
MVLCTHRRQKHAACPKDEIMRDSPQDLTTKPQHFASIRRVLQLACWAMALALLGFPVIARVICWPYDLPGSVIDAMPFSVLLAFLFLVTQALLATVPVRPGLLLVTLLVTAGVCLLVCHFADVGPVPDWLATLRRGPAPLIHKPPSRRSPQSIGIYQFDQRYGYGHIPNSSGRHESESFQVTYTIDDHGCRVTPTPESSRGTVLITGCSFTFGYGVEDGECFPAVLAREYWREHKVRNRGVCGYGTAHAYLTVTEAISGPEAELPALVLYAMISHHVKRNYLRRSYVGHLAEGYFLRGQSADPTRDRRGHPHFELEDGCLVQHGLAYLEDTVADSPCLRYPEFALTEAFLTEMQRQCVEKRVPFFVVLLPEHGDPEDEQAETRISAMLRRLQLSHLDISEMPLQTIRNDRHPNAASHQQFARAIWDSPIGQALVAKRARDGRVTQ